MINSDSLALIARGDNASASLEVYRWDRGLYLAIIFVDVSDFTTPVSEDEHAM